MGLLLVFPSSQIDINKLKFYLFLVKGCKNSLCVGRYRGSMEFQGCHDFFQKMFFFFFKKKPRENSVSLMPWVTTGFLREEE